MLTTVGLAWASVDRAVGGFYAANLALSRGYPRSKENDAFLSALFDELEKVPNALAIGQTATDMLGEE